ncbi:CHC2 zinc finger domain-containing protein [Azospirillum sp. HJ39]|uniref:CHC2 zinc finger domain-containing protein n=1 Tax=Azospirillum sp. HJ39 TaxID=3159496 RepID=UPI0035561E3E
MATSSSLADVDILEVAKKLGIQAEKRRQGNRVLALCPFHQENTPSFTLFPKDGRYHCFGCQANGGILDLIVAKGQATDYPGAFDWLRDHHFSVPDRTHSSARKRSLTDSDAIQSLLAAARAKADPTLLRSFAESRRFDPEALTKAGLLAVDLDGVVRGTDPNAEETRRLTQLGLIRRTDQTFLGRDTGGVTYAPFVSGPRIVIPIRNMDGLHVGAMARAVREGQEPKYKFPAGFERGKHLFGAYEAAMALRGGRSDGSPFFDLYLVEGVFDALRLVGVGQQAVASFGSSITQTQVKIVESLSAIAQGVDRTLRLHLFFDMDPAGREGTARALARLLGSAAEAGYLVDVVRPAADPATGKDDPDSWIRKRQIDGNPVDFAAITHPALHALIVNYLDDKVAIENVESYWNGLSWPEKFSIGQRIGRRLRNIDYDAIKARVRPDLTSLASASATAGQPATVLALEFESVIGEPKEKPSKQAAGVEMAAQGSLLPLRPLSTRLLDAVELAYEASSSREYPVDVGSWERIRKTALIFIPLLEARLKQADAPIRPYTAHYVPRATGKPRLKCGPCPEDAILQQHVLAELLRFDGDRKRMEAVPAVRWWPSSRKTITTGRGDRDPETVSFGYQIDMSALEGRPDRRNGRRDMFRPFIDCWNSYIAYVGGRLSRMRGPVHVARLDVRRFYDEIPRRLIRRKLDQMLGKLLDDQQNEQDQPQLCPELVGEGKHEEKLTRIRDWILTHSFGDEQEGYSYIDPLAGSVRTWGHRGRGLPQGPPLSAYLATIALFDLDRRMVKEVAHLDRQARIAEGLGETDRTRHGATYARYVDDLILIASSEADLRHLMNCVEEEVEKAGLRINDKTEVMVPKTIAEAREWLVERRADGFSYGGGAVEEMPAPVHEAVSSWADIPGLDRRHLLAVVLDQSLDDPGEYSFDAVLERLRLAADAGEELRESDHGFFARRILMRCAHEVWGTENGASRDTALSVVAEKMVDAWRSLNFRRLPFEPDLGDGPEEQKAHRALVNSGALLALFDGVERVLVSRPEMNPAYSDQVKKELAQACEGFMQAVRHGLLSHIREALFQSADGNLPVLGAQLAQYQIILEERAESAWRRANFRSGFEKELRVKRADSPVPSNPPQEAFWRLSASWTRHFKVSDPPDALESCRVSMQNVLGSSAANWQREVPFAAIHVGICLLEAQGLALIGAGSHNASPGKGDVMADLLLPPNLPEDPTAGGILAILQTWFGEKKPQDEVIHQKAAYALCILLKGCDGLSSILAARKHLAPAICGETGADLLPPPPISSDAGFLFFKDNELIWVRLAEDRQSSETDSLKIGPPADFIWTKRDSHQDSLFVRYCAPIEGGFEFLLPPKGGSSGFPPSRTAQLVDALVSRASGDHQRQSSLASLITAYAILYRVPKEKAEPAIEIKLAAYSAPAGNAQGQAFRREGAALVGQRTPLSSGDWLWRAGVAVSDALSPIRFTAGSATDDEESYALPHQDRERLEQILRRKLFARLQGNHLPPTVSSTDLDDGIVPRHIRRSLDALIAASDTGGDAGLPRIVQHFLEGRAMVIRKRRMPPVLESVPGGAAGTLARIGHETIKERDEFFQAAPSDAVATFGRATAAYVRVADALEQLAEQAEADVRPGLDTAAVGAGLWAVSIAWREFSLALLARKTNDERQSLLDLRPVLTDWGLGESVYLVDPRFGLADADSASFAVASQLDELAGTLSRALAAKRMNDARVMLDAITLLGWVVVAGMALAVVPMQEAEGHRRPAISSPLGADAGTVAAILMELANSLATLPSSAPPAEAAEWPWDIFRTVAEKTPQRQAEDVLTRVARLAGIEWHHPKPRSKALTDLDSQEGQFKYDQPETDYAPGHWQLVFSMLSGTLKDKQEQILGPGNVRLQVLTEVRESGSASPLVISVAGEALIQRSGLPQPSTTAQPPSPPIPKPADAPQEPPPEREEAAPDTAIASAEEEREDSPADVTEEQPQAAAGAPPSPPANADDAPGKKQEPDSISVDDVLRAWEKFQGNEWDRRKLNPTKALDSSYFRFAFLQTDFAEGYEDPTDHAAPLSVDKSLWTDSPDGMIPALRLHWPETLTFASPDREKPAGDKYENHSRVKYCPDEWRRRRVLMKVIETCVSFGVNALLLPEYSMRAETVLWLAAYVKEQGSDLSIWAGTFRVPSNIDVLVDQRKATGRFVSPSAEIAEDGQGTGEGRWQSLEAVLPVIVQKEGLPESKGTADEGGQFQIRMRRKKYPAMAYGEIFRPKDPMSEHGPILAGTHFLTRAESYITELICSEIFAFNGASSLRSIAHSVERLHNSVGGYNVKDDEILNGIHRNNDVFAQHTSFNSPRGFWPRRTVIFLPCITTRAKDYHIFGTNLHLAASSNIVFCNSSLTGLGNGGSCVIGFRSWDEKPNKSKVGPYHGVLPGLYVPSDGDGIKPLGPQERALVIVDIDPLHSALPSPRPQAIPEPVRLVAHLPVLEISRHGLGKWKSQHENWEKLTRYIGSLKSDTGTDPSPECTLVTNPASFMEKEKATLKSTNQLRHNEHRIYGAAVIKVLKKLESILPESPALKSRRKEFEKYHGGMPEAWAAPALTDWLLVDLKAEEFTKRIDQLKSRTEIDNGDDRRGKDEGLPLIWLTPPRPPKTASEKK